MGLVEQLRQLQDLRERGALSQAEFEQAKAALLRETGAAPPPPPPPPPGPASAAYLNIKHDDRSGLGKGVERGMEKIANDATQGCVKFVLGLGLAILILVIIVAVNAAKCSECSGSGKCTSSICVGGRTMLVAECGTCNGTAQCPSCKGSGWK